MTLDDEQKSAARELGRCLYRHLASVPVRERSVQTIKEYVAEFIAREYELTGVNLPFPLITVEGSRVDLDWDKKDVRMLN